MWTCLKPMIMGVGNFSYRLWRVLVSKKKKVCNLISECVETHWFSIMMNEIFKGIFKSKRELWKSDPHSLYQVILMEEVLSRLLNKSYEEIIIGRFFHPRGSPLISHILNANDLLVFANDEKVLVKASVSIEDL